MKDRTLQVGFSQRIRLEWLEATAHLMIAGSRSDEIYAALQDLLRDKVSIGGDAKRGTREKAITILMNTWVDVADELTSLRDRGLALIRGLPDDEHIALHWGMATAAYPFFGVVAANVGRLLRLQGGASPKQIQRRVREKYGERETVSRAARRVLRTFIDWGVLTEGAERGVYAQGQRIPVQDQRLIAWLVEAVLCATTSGPTALKAVLESPCLFPLALRSVTTKALTASGQIEIIRQGLAEDLVMLFDSRQGRAHKSEVKSNDSYNKPAFL